MRVAVWNVSTGAWIETYGWEAGLGTEVTMGAARLSLTGYVRRSTSLIDWARPGGSESTTPWQTMDVEEATFRGFELAVADVELLGGRWGAQASAISFDGSEASDFESKSARPVTRQVAVDVDRSVVADVECGSERRMRVARTRKAMSGSTRGCAGASALDGSSST